MLTLHRTGKAGDDGVLRLELPVGSPHAEFEVVIVLQPKPADALLTDVSDLSWAEFIDKTAGSIQDETFRRHDQGDYPTRLEF